MRACVPTSVLILALLGGVLAGCNGPLPPARLPPSGPGNGGVSSSQDWLGQHGPAQTAAGPSRACWTRACDAIGGTA